MVAVVMSMIFGGVALQASENEPSRVEVSVRQLGRGVANILSGLLEVPMNIYAINQQEGEMAAATYGTLRGVWRCLVRETVGVFEVLTFPVGLKPIVYPEFIAEEGPAGVILEPQLSTARNPYPVWNVKGLELWRTED